MTDVICRYAITHTFMHLEGTHTIHASPQIIWDMLMDPDVLAKVTPSVKSLEATGEGKYKALSEVKIGPVSGSFKGTLEVVDPQPPQQFTLVIKQNSRIGNVSAQGNIQLNGTEPSKTEVVFAGDAKLTGTLARTGQRVVGGVAKTLVDQFFKDLQEEIYAKHPPIEAVAEAEKPGLLARIIAFFKRLFGGGKKTEEKQVAA